MKEDILEIKNLSIRKRNKKDSLVDSVNISVKKGEVVGLTGDQLLREGIMVPFFGIETPTPQAAAVMSIKWNVPIYMVRVERYKNLKFKLSVEDKLKFPKNLDKDKAIYEITRLISKRIEEWIIDYPVPTQHLQFWII